MLRSKLAKIDKRGVLVRPDGGRSFKKLISVGRTVVRQQRVSISVILNVTMLFTLPWSNIDRFELFSKFDKAPMGLI